jgi:hypothetical protein
LQVAAWLFNRAQSEEVASTVSEQLKRRDADAALRGIVESSAVDDPSAPFFAGEALIGESALFGGVARENVIATFLPESVCDWLDLRCLAWPLKPAPSPSETLPSFKHRLAICASPGHDSTAIATEIANKLNLLAISVHEMIAECANLVVQDHEHLVQLPSPPNPIGDLVAAVVRLVAETLGDIPSLSATPALGPACAALQELCDNITAAATAISLDMKVAGATAIQCLQDAEEINDDLVVKLAIVGIRAAGLQLKRNQLETKRFQLWQQANDLAMAEWRETVAAKRTEVMHLLKKNTHTHTHNGSNANW